VARVLPRLVVDAGPVVSLLLGDAAAPEVAATLTGRDARISAVNVGEVMDVLMRVHRIPADDAVETIWRFLDDVAAAVPASAEHAERAGQLRARHYHRRHRDVSLADCFVVAVAGEDDEIATSDSAVAHMASVEGREVLALPNARGRRPRV
jgi:PIN domain nuclease of toxin-antitoxin system